MSRAVGRVVARQMDIAEWGISNRAEIKALAALRLSEEKGCIGYLNGFVSYIANYPKEKRLTKAREKKEKELTTQATAEGITVLALKQRMEKETPGSFPEIEKEVQEAADKESTPDTVAQYYEAQDLLKRMKWKRVTWDKHADYEGFARRVMDNDAMFKKVAAFSFMSLHIVHDARSGRGASRATTSLDFEPGCLTKKILTERTKPTSVPSTVADAGPKATIEHPAEAATTAEAAAAAKKTKKAAKIPAYFVDWEAGEARIADSISPQEIHQFLMNVAPRLQSVQVRMDEEQTKLTENIENCRVRLGVSAVKFNKYDRTVWDDPERKAHPDTYVTPAEATEFCDNVIKRAYLLRWYLKGTQVRIVKAGHPYKIDRDAREVHVPANFADYNFMPFHRRYETIEKFFNLQRTLWWLWFALGVLFVGDFEMI